MLTLNQAIDLFITAKEAEQLSDSTIREYTRYLTRFKCLLSEDKDICNISTQDIYAFLKSQSNLSKKSLRNIYICLSSFFTFLVREEYLSKNLMRKIKPPRAEVKAVKPYTLDEINAMLNAIEFSKPFVVYGKRPFTIRRPNALRNRAIILTLLDTGMRANELCSLKISDLNPNAGFAVVYGKGRKERIVPLSPITLEAIRNYLSIERGEYKDEDYLFVCRNGNRFYPDTLNRLLRRICISAGIKPVHVVHRFRHTFAIYFLKKTRNPFALKEILGHSTLEMVKRYLAIADADILEAHRVASPVMTLINN